MTVLHCKFSGDWNSERIVKIGQHLTKLFSRVFGGHFFWPNLYVEHGVFDPQSCSRNCGPRV